MRDVRKAVWTIAAGVAGVVGVVTCGPASPAYGAAAADAASPEPAVIVAQAAASYYDHANGAPPVLMAQMALPATPVVAMPQPAAPAVALAQGGVVRVVTPTGSQPGALGLIAIGAVLYRIGARVVRAS